MAIPPTPVDDLQEERLSRLAKASERLAAIAAEDGKAQRAELKNRDFTAALARTHPDLQEQLPQIAEAASAYAELLVLRAKQLGEAIKLIQADQARQKTRAGLV